MTELPVPEKRSDLQKIPSPMFSLNDVLRESLRALYENPGVVVRCEPLPFISGKKDELVRLFNMLIAMITGFKPAASKLFLYVDCNEGTANLHSGPGFRNFVIKFHTSITTSEAWKEQHKDILFDCEKIVTEHKGKFQVNNISNTGCLFAISLAGKFA